MRVIAIGTLREFWNKYPDAEEPLKAWFKEAKNADWKKPSDVKNMYRHASILKEGRVVFNISGNKYRLVVEINYSTGIIYVLFIGTHSEYDKVDVQSI